MEYNLLISDMQTDLASNMIILVMPSKNLKTKKCLLE